MKIKELIGISSISKKYNIKEVTLKFAYDMCFVGIIANNNGDHVVVLGDVDNNLSKEQLELLKDLYFEV